MSSNLTPAASWNFDSALWVGIIEIMKKKASKPSIRQLEVGVLLEDFNSKFDLVAEQTSQIPGMNKKIDNLVEDMEMVKTDLGAVKTDLEVVKVDMNTVKTELGAVKVDMEVVKTDLGFIKNGLKKKVDVDEFAALERRVVSLESRLR